MSYICTAGEIYDFIDGFAPFSAQQHYDNSGICAGSRKSPVSRVLTALDINCAVVVEAKEKGCELVISHHPVIFRPRRVLDPDDPAVRLAVSGISAICMHTSYDSAPGGMNDLLAGRLGLTPVGPLAIEDGSPMGYVCEKAEPSGSRELALLCKEKLGCRVVRYVNAPGSFDRIAVCSGSGGGLLRDARAKGCGALITGDVKHSDLVDAADCGFCLIDAGHFYTENIFHRDIARRLMERFPGLEVLTSECFTDPAEIV